MTAPVEDNVRQPKYNHPQLPHTTVVYITRWDIEPQPQSHLTIVHLLR
eukprot:SAG31_NODE_25426_length_461_cov_2.157459_1_plen_47_part_10